MNRTNSFTSQKIGILLVIACGVMWGISGVLGQYIFGASELTPIQLSILRQFGTGVLLLLYSFLKNGKAVFAVFRQGRKFISLLLFAVVGFMGMQLAYYISIDYSNAATGTVIEFTYIIMLLLYSAFVLRKMPKNYETIAILCAFAGIFLIATHGNPTSLAISKEALLWGLTAAVCFTVYCLYPQKLYEEFGLINVLAWGTFFSSIILAVLTRTFTFPSMSPDIVVSTVGVVLFGTLIPFILYGIGIGILGSVKASLFVTVEPVTSAVLAWLCLGTRFTFADICGFILILGAIEVVSVISFRCEGV